MAGVYPWVLLNVSFEYTSKVKFSHLWNAVGPIFFFESFFIYSVLILISYFTFEMNNLRFGK
jgi:hypothetical protein